MGGRRKSAGSTWPRNRERPNVDQLVPVSSVGSRKTRTLRPLNALHLCLSRRRAHGPRAMSSLRAGWWRAVSPRHTHAARPPRPRYIRTNGIHYYRAMRSSGDGNGRASTVPGTWRLTTGREPLLRRGGPLSSLFFVHDRETEVRSASSPVAATFLHASGHDGGMRNESGRGQNTTRRCSIG